MKFVDEYRDGELARKLADELAEVTTRPWALMTRCQGRSWLAGVAASAYPTWRARPGYPASRATCPYVATRPGGICATTP